MTDQGAVFGGKTLSEIIADAKARNVDSQKIAELEASRDRLRAMVDAGDRVANADAAVKAARAEAERLASAVQIAAEDAEAVERKHGRLFEDAVRPYRALRDDLARQRSEAAERLTANEAELLAAREHEAQVFAARQKEARA